MTEKYTSTPDEFNIRNWPGVRRGDQTLIRVRENFSSPCCKTHQTEAEAGTVTLSSVSNLCWQMLPQRRLPYGNHQLWCLRCCMGLTFARCWRNGYLKDIQTSGKRGLTAVNQYLLKLKCAAFVFEGGSVLLAPSSSFISWHLNTCHSSGWPGLYYEASVKSPHLVQLQLHHLSQHLVSPSFFRSLSSVVVVFLGTGTRWRVHLVSSCWERGVFFFSGPQVWSNERTLTLTLTITV